MLCVNNYPQAQVEACRSRMEAQLTAYRTLRAEVGGSEAVAEFEALFFAHLVVVLDAFFMHRSRTLEKKDGNPLNEVRMLAASIVHEAGVLAEDKSIKYKPEKSVLGLKIGDPIRLTEESFDRLFQAYFAEIQAKFVA